MIRLQHSANAGHAAWRDIWQQTRLFAAGKSSFNSYREASQFEGAATREIVTQAGTPKEKRFTGESYLLNYGFPHFFFHITAAYGILRHNRVEVGKKDYIGSF